MKKITVCIYYGDNTSFERCSGELIVNSEGITLEYSDNNDTYIFKGKELSAGHYVLEEVDTKEKATLHCFLNSSIYEGSWNDGEDQGMWRVLLD